MKTHPGFCWSVLCITALVFAGPGPLLAQETKVKGDELALQVADAAKANQAKLARYSWHVKSDLSMEGEKKATNVTQMRFNSEGKLETTTISSESTTKKMGGIRGRRQAAAMEDLAEGLKKILGHSFTYIFLSKGTLVDIFDKAAITQGEAGTEVLGKDIFVKGDELSISLDSTSKLFRKLTFKTTLDEDTITGAVTFALIEGGPNKPTHLEIQVPTRNLAIVSETYDWLEQK